MKKLVFAFVAVAALTIASCGDKAKTEAKADSTTVDTTAVDTTAVDTTVADTTAVDSAKAE